MGLELTGVDEFSQALQRGILEAIEPEHVLESMGAEAVELYQEGFDSSSDPYGQPWADLRSREGTPLKNTGKHLRDNADYEVSTNSVEIGTPFEWAETHQKGATIVPKKASHLVFVANGKTVFAKKVVIPQRKILPDDGLPQNWEDRLIQSGGIALVQFIEAGK